MADRYFRVGQSGIREFSFDPTASPVWTSLFPTTIPISYDVEPPGSHTGRTMMSVDGAAYLFTYPSFPGEVSLYSFDPSDFSAVRLLDDMPRSPLAAWANAAGGIDYQPGGGLLVRVTLGDSPSTSTIAGIPQSIGGMDVRTNFNGAATNGTDTFVITQNEQFVLVDLSDPSASTITGTFHPDFGSIQAIFPYMGDFYFEAYTPDEGDSTRRFNRDDPESSVVVGSDTQSINGIISGASASPAVGASFAATYGYSSAFEPSVIVLVAPEVAATYGYSPTFEASVPGVPDEVEPEVASTYGYSPTFAPRVIGIPEYDFPSVYGYSTAFEPMSGQPAFPDVEVRFSVDYSYSSAAVATVEFASPVVLSFLSTDMPAQPVLWDGEILRWSGSDLTWRHSTGAYGYSSAVDAFVDETGDPISLSFAAEYGYGAFVQPQIADVVYVDVFLITSYGMRTNMQVLVPPPAMASFSASYGYSTAFEASVVFPQAVDFRFRGDYGYAVRLDARVQSSLPVPVPDAPGTHRFSDTAMLEHLRNRQTSIIAMVHLDVGTDPVYAHTDIGDIEYLGDTYKGVGAMGGIDVIREDESLSPNSTSVWLRFGDDGIPDVFQRARGLDHKGRTATIYAAARDMVTGELVGNGPVVVLRGKMQQVKTEAGLGTGTVAVDIVDDRYVYERNLAENISNEAQQRRQPDDLFFAFQSDAANFNEKWGPGGPPANPPDRSPGRRNPGYRYRGLY